MSVHRDRRNVLRAGAAFCSLSLAGCLGVIDGDSGDETDGGNSSDGGNVSDDTDGNDSDGDENGGDPDWETIKTWPQLQYDAHNTGYVHAEAPTDVEELWSVETNEGVIRVPSSPTARSTFGTNRERCTRSKRGQSTGRRRSASTGRQKGRR